MTENVTLEIIKTVGIVITTIFSFAGLVYTVKSKNKVEEYHREVNGKVSKLLEVTGEAEKAKGNLEGRAELKEEQQK